MTAPLLDRVLGRAAAHRAKATGDHIFDADLLDEVARALLAAAERGDGWRPISEAPKDGTPILLAFTGPSMPPHVWIGKWNPNGDGWVDEHGNPSRENAVQLAVTGVWNCHDVWIEPSAPVVWRPLPSPPAGTGETS